jgi:hypothetical protein
MTIYVETDGIHGASTWAIQGPMADRVARWCLDPTTSLGLVDDYFRALNADRVPRPVSARLPKEIASVRSDVSVTRVRVDYKRKGGSGVRRVEPPAIASIDALVSSNGVPWSTLEAGFFAPVDASDPGKGPFVSLADDPTALDRAIRHAINGASLQLALAVLQAPRRDDALLDHRIKDEMKRAAFAARYDHDDPIPGILELALVATSEINRNLALALALFVCALRSRLSHRVRAGLAERALAAALKDLAPDSAAAHSIKLDLLGERGASDS